jgi:hypothetical protein
MAISTDVPIYTTTLASNATTIDIDLTAYQGYTNLKIVSSMKLLGADGIRMRFGNASLDTGSNYSFSYAYGTGSSIGSFSGANNTSASVGDGMSDSFGVYNWHIMNYSSTVSKKMILGKSGTPTRDAQIHNNLWNSTSPIKLIQLYTEGSGFAAGTTISVYGIGTASVAKATGGAIYSDSNYWYHVFTNTAAFVPTQSLSCDVMLVAGGGGGGSRVGGGGGAGGYRILSGISASATSYTITVGAGGAGQIYAGANATSGANSSALSNSATGGGYGGMYAGLQNGATGGSGGGANGNTTTTGSAGNAGSYTPVEGYAGGNSTFVPSSGAGGGGGGAAAAGSNGLSGLAGNGGAGIAVSSAWLVATGIGKDGYIAGGGGGGTESGYTPGVAGLGGGGTGSSSAIAATSGYLNTGSGGGGGGCCSSNQNGGNGASGIVIVRYAR